MDMRLKWGGLPPEYEQGVSQGVLYLDGTGVPWNGLVSVNEKVVGSIDVDHYFDGNRIHITHETGSYEATVLAYTYPDAFAEYNGYSTPEVYKRFGFSYRTEYGDSYHTHVVYDAMVRPGGSSWSTDQNSPSPSLFAWDIYGHDVPIRGARPASHLSFEVPRDASVQEKLDGILYGTATTKPRLPSPQELIDLFDSMVRLRITYNEDGSYTAEGTDDMVQVVGDGTFVLNVPAPYLVLEDEGRFIVRSY